jgi:tight adherence protein B
MLGTQLEAHLAARRIAKIEAQLADAIDLMVGALGAGASVATALQAASQETRQPLRRHLEDLLGRIRLGDDPRSAFETLARRVPLETFLLFASTLTVNWEVGGNLAPSLAAVGRTVRDRIEISRRIQSNIAQSHLSTLAVLSLTYFIALVVWRSDPDQMGAFLETELGKLAVAVTMVLQTLGMLWMSFISRMKF